MHTTEASDNRQDSPLLAAIDLGSNSFHLVMARIIHGEMRTLERLGEKVQLGAGLDESMCLDGAAMERGVTCLSRFAALLEGVPADSVRVVGTNALRAARNRDEFIQRAEAVLGHPVEVIAGREEARLVYLGVSHTLADDEGRRLVVDIGGGSTEFIIGERFEAQELESLHMGCVSYTRRFFSDGAITAKRFHKAVLSAQTELLNIRKRYKQIGWQSAVGSSGSFKAVEQVLRTQGWTHEGVTRDGLQKLSKVLLKFKRLEDIEIPGLKPERTRIFPGAVAILTAVFDALDIEFMRYSEGALREGVLYDQVGRFQHEDVRERTIGALMERYHVDTAQAQSVEVTALAALEQVADTWQLTDEPARDLLRWAARIHEIGLAISHSQFHKHGAYLLQHSDLPGFSRQEQQALAILVRGHRRKFPRAEFEALPAKYRERYQRLCILLRLGGLLNHSRSDLIPPFQLAASKKQLTLTFPEGWLDEQPLIQADLEGEMDYLKNAGFKLVVA